MRSFLPLVGGVLVSLPALGLASVTRKGFSDEHNQALMTFLRDRADAASAPPDPVVAVFAWPTSALVVTVGFVVGIVAFLYLLARHVGDLENRANRRLLLGIIGASAVAAAVISVLSAQSPAPHERIIEALLQVSIRVPRPRFTYVMDPLAALATSLLVGVCCVLCRPLHTEPDARRQQLVGRTRSLAAVIYIAAINLTAAVIQVYWLFRLPEYARALGSMTGSLHVIAAGLAAITGAYFTLLLIGVAGPAALVLAAETKQLAADVAPSSTPAQREDWLRENGFTVTVWQHIARAAAILAPFIAGLIGGPLGRAIAGLAG